MPCQVSVEVHLPSRTSCPRLVCSTDPILHVGGELGLRAELDHVRVLAEGEDAPLLGDLHRRRAVRVLGEDVGALRDEGLGGVRLLAGSYQEFTQTIFTFMSGLTDCAPSIMALIPR